MEQPSVRSVLDAVTQLMIERLPRGRANAWWINTGLCERWAKEAAKRLGRGEAIWLEDMMPSEQAHGHCVLLLDGRYYDSQNPEGVDSIELLDVYLGVTLDEWEARELERRREAWNTPIVIIDSLEHLP